jgi:hypothetical protein
MSDFDSLINSTSPTLLASNQIENIVANLRVVIDKLDKNSLMQEILF